jgi:hypothetical protein
MKKKRPPLGKPGIVESLIELDIEEEYVCKCVLCNELRKGTTIENEDNSTVEKNPSRS